MTATAQNLTSALRRCSGRPALMLGTMNFGKRTEQREAVRIMERSLELGIQLFDTANAYTGGESERIVGRFMKGRRDEILVATKVGFGRVGGKPEGLAPERVLAACDESLERLQTDHIDLYYLHVPDHGVPVDETLGAIKQLVDAGKVQALGVSNYASWQLLELLLACDRVGLARPVVAQQLYNMLIRQLDLEYFRFAAKYCLPTTVYNPLAGGLLSGRYQVRAVVPKGSRFEKNQLYLGRYWSATMLDSSGKYLEIAERNGLSLVEMAYAWLRSKAEVDSVLIGPGCLDHLEDAHRAFNRSLSPELLAEIERRSKDQLGTETSYAR